MTTQLVNLTEQSVNHHIEQTLEKLLDHQSEGDRFQGFANPDFHNELVAYVLNRVKSCYATVEPGSDLDWETASVDDLPEACQLDPLIHQGIEELLKNRSDWVQQHIPQPSDDTPSGGEPSHWFG